MSEEDSAFEALREAIDAYARARASEMVTQAGAAAEARVHSMLTDALAHSMLEHAQAELAGPHGRPDPGPQPAPTTQETGLYVYGVVAADGAALPTDLSGVDRSGRVVLIAHGGLAAIASRVSLAQFGEEQLHEHLNDVDWLEEIARAHEAVLDEALSRMTVVPMRLCTIYRSEAQVKEMLANEQEVFADALIRLEGSTEWGVKLIAEPGALERAANDAHAEGDDDSLSPGVAYMRGRSREARERDELDRIAEAWAEEVHERLAHRAAEALVNPIQNPEVSGHVGDMLLNGVYLVPDADGAEFRGEVAGLAEEFAAAGASVELSGPWPPYNFVKGSIEAAR